MHRRQLLRTALAAAVAAPVIVILENCGSEEEAPPVEKAAAPPPTKPAPPPVTQTAPPPPKPEPTNPKVELFDRPEAKTLVNQYNGETKNAIDLSDSPSRAERGDPEAFRKLSDAARANGHLGLAEAARDEYRRLQLTH